MTLVETLNNIHFVGDSYGITFLPGLGDDGKQNEDIDPDIARLEVAQFIDDQFVDLQRDENFIECARNLCIYGAALFNAIDQHDEIATATKGFKEDLGNRLMETLQGSQVIPHTDKALPGLNPFPSHHEPNG